MRTFDINPTSLIGALAVVVSVVEVVVIGDVDKDAP